MTRSKYDFWSLRPPRWRRRWLCFFRGCSPGPRPMFGGSVWQARWCVRCGRYPCGRWRLGDPVTS